MPPEKFAGRGASRIAASYRHPARGEHRTPMQDRTAVEHDDWLRRTPACGGGRVASAHSSEDRAMLGLSTLGIIHTVISLIGLGAGFVALFRHREIAWRTRSGQLFVLFTVGSAVTGLFIFRHGTFGPPHVLSLLTLAVLALAFAAERGAWFGRLSRYVATVGFSLAFFFHFIPGFTETSTRLPVGAPLTTGPEDPKLQAAIGVVFLLFLIGATLQVLKLRAQSGAARVAKPVGVR
jgi:uncharacterized membrane protein